MIQAGDDEATQRLAGLGAASGKEAVPLLGVQALLHQVEPQPCVRLALAAEFAAFERAVGNDDFLLGKLAQRAQAWRTRLTQQPEQLITRWPVRPE